MDQAGAGRRHHPLFQPGRNQADVGETPGMGHPAGPQYRHQPARRGGVLLPGYGLRAAAEWELILADTSWPGLTRPSTTFFSAGGRTWMPGPSPRRRGFGPAGGTSPGHDERNG